MSEERLNEIRDSIEFQMQLQQSLGYKSRYDDLLTEEIELYNEVIDLQERRKKAIEYLAKCNDNDVDTRFYSDKKPRKNILLEILKGEPNNENK